MERTSSTDIKWATQAKTDSKPIIRLGMWSIGFIMLVFIGWGSFFQLSSAVITPGTVVSEGRNKKIQHPVGGRIAAINVEEGDHLTAGQVIMHLDKTNALADLSKINARHASLSALLARLDAERSGGSRSMIPARPAPSNVKFKGFNLRGGRKREDITGAIVLRGTDGENLKLVEAETVAEITTLPARPINTELMQSQRDAFDSGRMLLSKEIEGLQKKKQTLERQKSGVAARIGSQEQLIALTEQEIVRLRPLVKQGYVARNRLGDRERTRLEMAGNIAALRLDAAAYENQIAEVDAQIEKARATSSDTASREYARIVAELSEVSDQRRAAKAAADALVVIAPENGMLTNLSVTTTGGVIGGGDVVGEIVPDGAPLLVEARVAPADISYVKAGQKADIAITAFDRRLDDTLHGKVAYVSADAEKDEKTGEQFFIARLRLVQDTAESQALVASVQAGMQGEVYIHTGSRTFLTYLGKPLIDSFRRAFKER